MARLKLKNLDIKRSQKVLVRGFCQSFDAGLVYALVGNNGAGKTTLLKTLAGLLTAPAQQIFIDGRDLNALDERERANSISFMLQHSVEQPYCTALSRVAHGLMPIFGFDFSLDRKTLGLIEEVAKRLNISHLLNRRLVNMSGGEQRLIHLAKCLVNPNTKILLLDEPSVFLDFSQQSQVGSNLRVMAQKGQLVIFSSHDAGFIERFADGVISIAGERALVSNHAHKTSSFNFLASNDDMAVLTSSPS